MNRNKLPPIFPIPILNVNAFLIQSRLGYILVDTGIPFQEKRILRALIDLDLKLTDIHAIILTHGHLDHIGCLAQVQKQTGASVICHRSLESTLKIGGYEQAIPRVWIWKVFNPLVSAVLGKRMKPVEPQQVVEDCLDLREFGLNGVILHTPGHSPGSCSLLLENGIYFIGDLLRGRSPGIFDTGLFYHDRDQILASLEKIASRQPRLIYLSHGTTMSGEDLDRFLGDSQDHRHSRWLDLTL